MHLMPLPSSTSLPPAQRHADPPRATAVGVLIVDEHDDVRRQLHVLLHGSIGIVLAGEARSVVEACGQLSQLQTAVVLARWAGPGQGGLATVRAIRRDHPATPILVLSTATDAASVLAAFRAGSSGYLAQSHTRLRLSHAILAVAHGGMLVAGASLQHALGLVAASSGFGLRAAGTADPQRTPLTRRELDVLQLMANGKTNRDIAHALSFAEVTIKQRVTRIIATLNAADRTHAAVIAHRLGLLDRDEQAYS